MFGEDARAQAQSGIGARVEILSEQRLALGVSDEVGEEGVEMLWRHRIVVVPPHRSFGLGVPDHELVLGAASRMRARVGDEGPMRGDLRFVALQRVLIELRRAEVPVDRLKVAESEPVRAKVDIVRPVLDHASSVPLEGAPGGARAYPSK